MTLADLIARYRIAANDKVEPYFVTDDELRDFLNDAEREAAIRGRLIHESADTDVCEIAVVEGTAVYPLHVKLYEITHCAFRQDGFTSRCAVRLTSTGWLDRNVCDWRDRNSAPEFGIQSDKDIRLAPTPSVAGTLLLEGYRLPMEDMEEDDDQPEIHEAHHIQLIQWALYRAFSIPDTEFFDASRADAAEQEFTRYFGIRPDADLRRITREDVPHRVEAFLP